MSNNNGNSCEEKEFTRPNTANKSQQCVLYLTKIVQIEFQKEKEWEWSVGF